jgi:hypothetical protein
MRRRLHAYSDDNMSAYGTVASEPQRLVLTRACQMEARGLALMSKAKTNARDAAGGARLPRVLRGVTLSY